jgi:hypothetical protein
MSEIVMGKVREWKEWSLKRDLKIFLSNFMQQIFEKRKTAEVLHKFPTISGTRRYNIFTRYNKVLCRPRHSSGG